MRKLSIIAAAGAFAAMTGAILVVSAQAAPAKDPMCTMGPQMTNQSWQDHYHCWSGPVAKPVAAAPSKKDPMCGMGAQMNNVSWSEHYNCWGPAKKW
jgi:hypothetical protein